MPDVMERVPALLRQAAAEHVMPVFERLSFEAEEKTPGEWVTVADRAAEAFLTPALTALVPGSAVVGEEAASDDPAVLDALASDGHVWLLDPLDGTGNFASGTGPFAIMAALLRDGEVLCSWVLDPLAGRLCAAERGGGAWLEAERLSAAGPPRELAQVHGSVFRRFLPAGLLSHVEEVLPRFGSLAEGSRCAGHEYPLVASGDLDFALFWRTLPWDHAPGVLLATEAGAIARRLDGRPFRAAEHTRLGLLVARSEDTWDEVAAALVPARHRPEGQG